MSNSDTSLSSDDTFGGPSSSSLKQLASQLEQWRGMLPPDLQWAEDDPFGFPKPQSREGFNQPLDPNLSPHSAPAGLPLFTADLDSEPVHYPYAYDIQVALLRTRFYYAKYMVYRPFVYKALHFPDQMTQEDAEGAAECLRVCSALISSLFLRADNSCSAVQNGPLRYPQHLEEKDSYLIYFVGRKISLVFSLSFT
jgi:hypothetical protein